jgi:S1-C subfamily serine protease
MKIVHITLTLIYVLALFSIDSLQAQEKYDLSTLLMKSTFKITGKNSMGTGFIIGKPIKPGADTSYYVLVTAAHVLESVKDNTIVLHLRKKKGNGYVRTPLEITIRKDDKKLWNKHPKVDVAAMYVSLPNGTDIALLPTTFLATDEILETYEVRPGDQLFALGYPLGQESNSAGFPILRAGILASYPILPTRETEDFLFDFEVYKGNSGGPVFLIGQNRFYKGAIHIGTVRMIVGLVSKERGLQEIRESIYETEQKTHPLKLGVVIHASFIRETIDMLPDKPKQ